MGKPGIPGKISYVYGGSPEKRRARNADLYSAGQSRADVNCILNLFKILSGLVETSLLRALEYQKAVEYRQYVKGTHILKTEYFEERLKVQHDMREQKLASYVLLKVEYSEMSLKEADEILRSKVRENDVWGISESKELYLMLVQTDKEALPIILARLKQAGLVCRQIDEELTGNNRTGENK